MTRKSISQSVFCLGALILAACAQGPLSSEQPPRDTPPGSNTGVAAGTKEGDWAAIERLEAQARAIAKTNGCSSSSECRAAPVGNRSCGGPRYYLPYCAKATDSVALFSKLAEVAKAEGDYNRKYEIMSTCEFRTPPDLGVVGGVCTAK